MVVLVAEEVGGVSTPPTGEAQFTTTVNEEPPPDSLAILSSPNVTTSTRQTSYPAVYSEGVGTPTPEGDPPTGDPMTVNEEPTQPAPLATQEEANPISMRHRIARIKVIGRRPPGYVERVVLQDLLL